MPAGASHFSLRILREEHLHRVMEHKSAVGEEV